MRCSLSLILRFLLFLLLPLLACSRESVINNNIDDIPQGETVFSLLMSTSEPEAQVKSSLFDDNDMSKLNNVVIYGIDDVTRQWKRVFLQTTASKASTTLSFQTGHPVTFYALGNMGDVEIPVTGDGDLNPESFVYLIPNAADLRTSGIPMAAKLSLPAEEFTASSFSPSDVPFGTGKVGEKAVSIKLDRLMAKVVVSINKTGLTAGAETAVLESEYVRVRQANRRMRPFHPAGSAALSTSDLFSGAYEVFDIQDFSTGGEYDMTHADIVLYIPENRQGFIAGEDYYSSTATDIGVQGSLCTYIEYEGYKNGNEDGVYGNVSYRGLLGNSSLDSDDFSVCRNTLYTASLSLTWNGLVWTADGWRIDASDITDGRRLRFLDENGNETSYLKIHRKGTGDIYAYFSIDGGITGAMGRKDANSYPFGWKLLFDGTVLSGHDSSSEQYDVATGLSVKCLGEETVGGKKALHLQVSAGPTAEVTTSDPALRSVLSLRTTDNKVSASPLLLDVEDIPFTLQWLDGAPNHVGQKATLQCIDPYTNQLADDYTFHLNSAFTSSVSLIDNGDGTASVSLLSPFTPQNGIISVTDGDGGREGRVSMEARLPYFECTDLWTTYVDASSSMRFTYYATASDGTNAGTILMVKDESAQGYTGNGNQLDKALVESCLRPIVVGTDGRLGYTYTLLDDGVYELDTYLNSYSGLNPSGSSFVAEHALVMMEKASYRTVHETDFVAWNPWSNITTIQRGEVLDDYTLYAEPDEMAGGWKSKTFLSAAPSSESYTMQIRNVVVADEANVGFNAKPQLGNVDYIGSICSGTPQKTTADFNDAKWTLTLKYTLPGMYNIHFKTVQESLEALRQYLNASFRYTFQDIQSLYRYLSDNAFTLVLSNNFQSEAEAIAALPTVTPIQYASFSIKRNSEYKTWTMTYSMEGKTDENMLGRHGAGPVDIVLEIKNQHSNTYLRKQVAIIYMRLHVYFYPAPKYGYTHAQMTPESGPLYVGVIARTGGFDFGHYLENSMVLMPFTINGYSYEGESSPVSYYDGLNYSDPGHAYPRINPTWNTSTLYGGTSLDHIEEFRTDNPIYKYIDYGMSFLNPESVYGKNMPFEWIGTGEYNNPGGSYYKVNSNEAYLSIDPHRKDWDPKNENNDGRLIHLHIIPYWYYTYVVM